MRVLKNANIQFILTTAESSVMLPESNGSIWGRVCARIKLEVMTSPTQYSMTELSISTVPGGFSSSHVCIAPVENFETRLRLTQSSFELSKKNPAFVLLRLVYKTISAYVTQVVNRPIV